MALTTVAAVLVAKAAEVVDITPVLNMLKLIHLSINQSIHVYFRHMVHSYTTTQ